MQKRFSLTRALVLKMALAAGALLGGTMARAAQVSVQAPSGTMIAIEIPNTAVFWQKAHALSLAQGIEKYLGSPAVASNLEFQTFDLERQKLGQSLGFPVTPEELLGNVFSSAMIYAPPKGTIKDVSGVMVLGVKDKAKAAKLLEVIDQKNKQAASAGGTSSTLGATPDAGFTFETTKINNLPVSHFHSGKTEGYYALIGDRVIFSNGLAGFNDAATAPLTKRATLDGDAEFKRLKGVLSWDDAELVGWVDSDALVKAGGAAAMNPMLASMPGLSSDNKVAFTVHLLGNGFLSKVATSADPAKASPNIKPSALPSLRQFGPKPLIVAASGLFDPAQTVQELKSVSALSGVMGGLGGSSGPDPAAAMKEFETATGLSVEKDLVPSLGNEVAFGLNSLKRDPNSPLPIPMVDMVLSVQVRDAAKMQGVMQKLEASIIKAFEGMPGGPASATGQPVARAFKTVPAGARQLRVLDLGTGFPVLTPSYVLLPDELIFGLNDASVLAALDRIDQKSPALTSSPLYAEMTKYAGGNTKLYSYSQLDVTSVVNFAGAYMPMLGAMIPPATAAQIQEVMGDILVHVGSGASIATMQGDVPVAYTRLVTE